jgi:hypothetical protein
LTLGPKKTPAELAAAAKQNVPMSMKNNTGLMSEKDRKLLKSGREGLNQSTPKT